MMNIHGTWAGLGGPFSRIDHRNSHYRACECFQCRPHIEIPKGTTVNITTINGGDSVAVLLSDYRPTYCAVLDFNGACVVINAGRISSITPV
jgi:hypothetical protein